jgi:hypothetical protein
VDYDQCGSVAPDGSLEDFSHMNLGRLNRALVNLNNLQHPVARVEQNDPQVFLFQRGHLIRNNAAASAGPLTAGRSSGDSSARRRPNSMAALIWAALAYPIPR